MNDETITVRCLCGWEMTGPENDVVFATTEHGRRLHNMTATRDEVLAMAAAASDHKAAGPPNRSTGDRS